MTWPDCVNDRSVYTREGAEDVPYLCQNNDDSMLARCQRTRHDVLNYCTGNAWTTGGSVSISDCSGSAAFEVEQALEGHAEEVLVRKGVEDLRFCRVALDDSGLLRSFFPRTRRLGSPSLTRVADELNGELTIGGDDSGSS